MKAAFAHLHVHSEYSLDDGLLRVKDLIARSKALAMPAVAITDQNNLFAVIKFYRAAVSAGIKPIVGADLWVQPAGTFEDRYRVVLLCQNTVGYRNLSRLITRSYTEGQQRGVPALSESWLSNETLEGLIGLSGIGGNIAVALLDGKDTLARRHAEHWRQSMPERFYLELTRTSKSNEPRYIDEVLVLAEQLHLPVVATNDVRFSTTEDFEAHEARVCIRTGRVLADPRRPRNYTPEQYLRSTQEMSELFQDVPSALENSVLIAQRCNLEIEFDTYHLPIFPVADDENVDTVLREQTYQGLDQQLAQRQRHDTPQAYQQRLEAELDVITKMGFSGYFLIVADFIAWAKAQGIPVGPGRGSGAGSLAAYALGITEIDPLQYDLLFERFLNPERISMPDFDIDFCMERRDEVIEYVAQRYGRTKVAQIITYGTMAAKAVVRDVGRILGMPYGFVDQIAKLIPFDPNMTLAKAFDEEPQLQQRYDDEDEFRAVIDLARALEGLARNAGKHAGGLVIAPRDLTEFMPLYCEEGADTVVTQFDMGDVESVGLVKFDFLGLRTLTIIDWAVNAANDQIQARGGTAINIRDIPLDDSATFKLIQRAATTAVFQLESRGMKELIKRLKPDHFGDLIALVALFRPGPLQSGMVDDFIERKHGRAAVRYPHPALEAVLQPTYGVILYQEQVMQIAQVLSGYTLGAADMLRRAMGKKKADEMAQQRQIFVDGAVKAEVDENVAAQIFDLMEKFAGYGFNKSHSAAYALVAYQTAWLKAHYPGAFMAAVLSADMDSTDKVMRLRNEAIGMDLKVDPPDINVSQYRFSATGDEAIHYGLGAIKGLGEAAIEQMIAERDNAGPYKDLFDLCGRNSGTKLNRRALEAMIKSGAMDTFEAPRAGMMRVLEKALKAADQQARAQEAGQSDMFGLSSAGDDVGRQDLDDPWREALSCDEWPDEEWQRNEKEGLGFYLSKHPIDKYQGELGGLVSCSLAEIKPGRKRVIGMINEMRMNNSRRGRMAILTLDDNSALMEVTIYNELFEQCFELLIKDRIVIIEGECKLDKFSGEHAIVADSVSSIVQARNRLARALVIEIDDRHVGNGFMENLRASLERFRSGECVVEVEYRAEGAEARLKLADDWRVGLSDGLLETLRQQFGEAQIRVEY